MALYTTGDVLKLTGFPATTFDDWCSTGLIKAVSGGNGHGNHRIWSLLQAVGLVVARQARESEFGCSPKFVGKTVEAFSNVTEEWLQEQLQRGQRYYIKPCAGRPLLSGDKRAFGCTNVEEAYQRVMDHATAKVGQ